ncbi:MAG: RNA polymerase sigma factor [Planctomycetes bacterium]|nr:RNA polymerase sigma factor [Planctomycetota bacterium]
MEKKKPDSVADADAGEFFLKFYPELFRRVSAITGASHADVDDIVQETFLQAWRDRRRFNGHASPLTWLNAIARNRAMDFNRRKRLQRHAGETLRGLTHLDREDLPEEVLEDREVGARVRRALNDLPPEYTKLLLLRYLEDLSVPEIATRLHESEDAIESRLRRAREAFRKILQNEVRDES